MPRSVNKVNCVGQTEVTLQPTKQSSAHEHTDLQTVTNQR